MGGIRVIPRLDVIFKLASKFQCHKQFDVFNACHTDSVSGPFIYISYLKREDGGGGGIFFIDKRTIKNCYWGDFSSFQTCYKWMYVSNTNLLWCLRNDSQQ